MDITLNQLRNVGVSILIGTNGSGKTYALQRMNREFAVNSIFLGADMPRQALTGHLKMWLKKCAEIDDALVAELLNARGWAVDADGKPWSIIQPSYCSAGQLRMLWMFLSVAVGCSENGIVLIDEAEQSLHVGWQRRLVWDLERLAKRRNVRVILSTHAPAVIDDAWEWVVSLDEDTRGAKL